MPHFPPPPPLPPKHGPFRRVPPAVFPAILGLLGLVAIWRRAVDVFGAPAAAVDLAVGMVALVFLFALGAYAGKVMLRPGVLIDDAATLPGRTGLAALAIGLMVLAALLEPFARGAALASLAAGFLGLLVLALWVLPGRLKGTDPAGPPTPALHLVYAGFILAPGAALPLGVATGAMPVLIWYSALAAAVVTLLTIRPLLTGAGAPPLRPLHAIHLAPVSFVASDALATGQVALGSVALIWSCLVALLLLFRARWLTAGEFSGFWSAFTFPVTGFAGALLDGYAAFGSEAARVAGGVILVAATLGIPVIAVRVFKLWATGMLAAKTNAAVA